MGYVDQSMLYRRFGRTDLQVSVFSFSGIRHPHHWNHLPEAPAETDMQHLEGVIRQALASGINHFDIGQGDGFAGQLGQFLPALPRDRVIVQARIAPEDDPDRFLANFNDLLERLQLDDVDLLTLHGVNDEQSLHRAIASRGCLAAARKLQQEGKASHIGFSTQYTPSVALKAVAHEGHGGFDYVRLPWCFIDQSNWPTILEARNRDMGVCIVSPLERSGASLAPSSEFVQLCDPLHPMVFSGLFCLAHPQVHTLSLKVEQPGDFNTHLQTLPLIERADHILSPIITRLRDAMMEATGVAEPTEMSVGLPEWHAMPGRLNAAAMLWLRNITLGWGMTDYARAHFNLFGKDGQGIPGSDPNIIEQISDEALRQAAGDSPFALHLPDLLREAINLLSDEEPQQAGLMDES